MEKNSKKQNTDLTLKIIIAVLAVFFVGSLAYMYKMSNDSKLIESKLISEKDTVISDLENLKATYDAAIAEKTTLSEELSREREKVEQLIRDLKKSEGVVVSLSKYKAEFKKLEAKMKSLIAENQLLKEQNKRLTTERDSTMLELGAAKQQNDTLAVENANLSKAVKVASELSVINLKAEAINERSSGRQIVTEKSNRANKLKVCFTIAENKIANSGDRVYYIQIISSKDSSVLGENKTINFEDKDLTYSLESIVKYQNKDTDICEFLSIKERLAKGTYFINVFDGKNIVSKTSLTLK